MADLYRQYGSVGRGAMVITYQAEVPTPAGHRFEFPTGCTNVHSTVMPNYTLFEMFWWISLYVTDEAIAKLYVT